MLCCTYRAAFRALTYYFRKGIAFYARQDADIHDPERVE
jgi:hypothetical protein